MDTLKTLSILAILVGSGFIAREISLWANNQPKRPDPRAIIAGPEREGFIKAAMESCLRVQSNHPDNRGVAAQVIWQYCNCAAEHGANMTTNADLAPNALSAAELQTRANIAGNSCAPR